MPDHRARPPHRGRSRAAPRRSGGAAAPGDRGSRRRPPARQRLRRDTRTLGTRRLGTRPDRSGPAVRCAESRRARRPRRGDPRPGGCRIPRSSTVVRRRHVQRRGLGPDHDAVGCGPVGSHRGRPGSGRPRRGLRTVAVPARRREPSHPRSRVRRTASPGAARRRHPRPAPRRSTDRDRAAVVHLPARSDGRCAARSRRIAGAASRPRRGTDRCGRSARRTCHPHRPRTVHGGRRDRRGCRRDGHPRIDHRSRCARPRSRNGGGGVAGRRHGTAPRGDARETSHPSCPRSGRSARTGDHREQRVRVAVTGGARAPRGPGAQRAHRDRPRRRPTHGGRSVVRRIPVGRRGVRPRGSTGRGVGRGPGLPRPHLHRDCAGGSPRGGWRGTAARAARRCGSEPSVAAVGGVRIGYGSRMRRFPLRGVAPRRTFTPVQRRIAEIAEYATIATVVPLACWVAGVYAAIRGL